MSLDKLDNFDPIMLDMQIIRRWWHGKRLATTLQALAQLAYQWYCVIRDA